MNTKGGKLIVGKYYELTKNINAIPSGVYRYTGREDLMLCFSVGNKIHISLSDDCLEFLEKVPGPSARKTRTTSSEYLERYYELLELQRNKPFSVNGPFTACFIFQQPSAEGMLQDGEALWQK